MDTLLNLHIVQTELNGIHTSPSESLVSIITVNYNGWKDTCALIDSLKRYETHPYEVVVVDNASFGDDADWIGAAHPDVTLVRSDRNLGFAGGNNLALKSARGKYLLFLNNDMEIKAPFLAPLVQRLADEKIGGVTPAIYYFSHPERLQYYGYSDLTPITLRHTTELFRPEKMDEYLMPRPTEVLHGAAMMVRRDVIERVGPMTEVYFLFYEEFDWSRRMREAGHTLYYEPDSVVYHKESMSIPRATPFREYYLSRSRVLYARRNCKGWRKWVSCVYLLCFALPRTWLRFMGRRRWDLMKAAGRGTLSGLFSSTEKENRI